VYHNDTVILLQCPCYWLN